MAMAQVFIPGPHDSIPPLLPPVTSSSLLPPTTSPSFPLPTSPPLPIPTLPEDDIISCPPPAPPPSPEMQPRHLESIFEINPEMFETPRRSELPPSPTNSLDFSTLFTPNKSPLVSEPDSPTHLTPGDLPDSTHSPPHLVSPPYPSSPAPALNIPISPTSTGSSGHGTMLSHSHTEGNSFHGIRSQTAFAQHSRTFDNSLLTENPGPVLRPRSHTHPSHSLNPYAAYISEQLRQRSLEVRRLHPHLPLSFETAQIPHSGPDGQIADSGYHEEDPPSPRKKNSKKRKSDELGMDPSSLFYSCDSYPGDWLVIQNTSTYPKGKKACQEGEYVMRRQSASFSGGLTLPNPGLTDSCNFSAPPTPNPSLEGSGLHNSLLFPSSLSPHHGSSTLDVTPTFTPDPLSSLQSMEVGEMEDGQEPDNQLDSLDSMDCGLSEQNEANEMECLTNTLRGSHLGRGQLSSLHPQVPHALPQILTASVSPPAMTAATRCHSSGEGHTDFSQTPQFSAWQVTRSAHPSFSSYHRGDSILNSASSAESKFLLSKSL